MNNSPETIINNLSSTFENVSGFTVRKLKTDYIDCSIVFIKDLTDLSFISENAVAKLEKSTSPDILSSVSVTSAEELENDCAAADLLCRGSALIVNSDGKIYVFPAPKTEGRGVTEPTSDVTIRGPKAGFTESAEKNLSMLASYIRTPDFKSESFVIGEISKTKVILVYVKNRADEKILKDVKTRLENLKANVITDSGNVSMLLSGAKNSFLPVCGSTEKVDKAASKLMSGRLAVIVDGSPFVLTLPYVFAESLQASDDYLHTFLYATFIRLLRLLAFLASIFAPALLCAAVKNDGSFLPSALYGMIDKSRADIPVSFFWEIMTVLILFELLREVGVRMPRTVGDAVGIVGSIILGNTAVDAGIVSSVGVITVAFAAVCSFITPAYMYVVVLARILVLVLSELFGFYGIAASALAFLLVLVTKKSFGVPYLTPLFPPDLKGMMDFIFAYPKKTLGKREKLGKK